MLRIILKLTVSFYRYYSRTIMNLLVQIGSDLTKLASRMHMNLNGYVMDTATLCEFKRSIPWECQMLT